MYKTKSKRPTHFDFDLIVIGSGAGGGVAALIAADGGKKVAIVEADIIGGECPNYGCVPTKSLLQSAEVYQAARNAGQFGVHATSVTYDYSAINAWKEKAIFRTGANKDAEAYRNNGITVLRGYAHFLSPWQIALAGERFTSKNFLIATGTKSRVPPIDGLKETGYIGFREAIAFKQPAKSIFIIGGGAIGCEFAQLFWSFDSKVHIADIDKRLMSREDKEVGDLVAGIFKKKGIGVYTNTRVVKVSSANGKKTVALETDGRRHSVIVDEILLAAGKTPNLDLGLDNARVRYDRRGLIVNSRMQTTTKHIYAAGDVVGPYMFTHTAVYQSRIAAHNMYSKKKVSANYHAVPLCIFVDPEVASVGPSEQELRDKGIKIQIGMADISIISRSNTTNQTTGFVKVIASHTGVLLGASIVSPRAGEMIHELALAVHKGLKARDIVDTIHAFPTWSEAIRVACSRIKNS
jgi:pyruvate/2-oxoglutarate dehydrogenase complex dihydrolipoamide dehydrogenase (E3) component